jgi:hypothetical protein
MIRIFESIKNLAYSFINMSDKKKQREIVMVLVYLITAITMIFSDQIFSIKTTTLFRPAGNVFENLPHSIIGGNIVYSFYFLDFIKYNLISFFFEMSQFFINSNIIVDIENSLFDLNLFFWKNGCENIFLYTSNKYAEALYEYDIFCYKYFSFGFYKAVLFRSNLPIFFYFGLLFILTTIFSLLLLSYYGFYGVFFLNLITILFF